MLNIIGEVTRRAGQSPASRSPMNSQAQSFPTPAQSTPGQHSSQSGQSQSGQSQTQSPSAPVSTQACARRTNKACTNCARIKCKCIPRAGLDPSARYGCERCHRLGKTCEPSVAVVPAARKVRTTTTAPRAKVSTSRSARLEAKLNDLVDLLKATHATPTNTTTPSGATDAAPAPQDVEDDDDSSDDAEGDDDDESPQSMITGATTVTSSTTVDDLLPHEAEACLRRFTEDMLPLAPFVLLTGPDCTVRRLQQDFPFLWRCIEAAAAVHPAHRIRAAAAARKAIVRRVVEHGERSLDVLLGLLTFVTWVHLSTKDRFHRNFATVASQLAVCVAWDLGLTMPPLLEPTTQSQRFVPVVQIPGLPASMWKTQRSMEERRAVLGVYLVTAVTSQMFRSADGLRWSPYLEQVLGEVEASSQEPQDKTLTRQVRIQLLINEVRYASTGGSGGMAGGSGGNGGGCATGPTGSMYRSFGSGQTQLPGLYMESLRRQLDDIVGVVDGTSPAFENFTTHNLYHFAILAIHESVLSRKPGTRNNPGLSSVWLPDLQRFEIYQRCLASVHAWFERLFAWPLSFYHCLPSGTYLQMFYVLVCLHKLTTLKDPAWNVEAVRGVMDLFPTIDRILGMCHELREMMAQQVAQSPGSTGTNVNTPATATTSTSASRSGGSIIEQDDHDPILVAIRKFSTLKVIWQNEMVAQEREKQEAAAAHATGPLLVDGQPVADVDLDTPMETDFFSNYSLDVLNYFHAMPDMADLSWP